MIIAGVDEAGRGPVLGPMVLAVCTIDKNREEELIELGVKDSKQLTQAERERQFPKIKEIAAEFLTCHIHPAELDKLMNRKSLNEIEAMKIGFLLNSLKTKPELVIIDSPDTIAENFGKRIQKYLNFETKLKCEHKADVNYPIVSAASVLAKVERDLEIKKLSAIHGKIGSGYSHDPDTRKFLEEYIQKNEFPPEFCRKQWMTTQNMLDAKKQQKLF
ncbi:MAG: ribonuclease HII [Candidatus Micrarchaeota archaeon]